MPRELDQYIVNSYGDRQIHGGVLIAMKSKFIVECTGRGSLIEGRDVYIRIKHSCGHFGILNIYAPNSATERQEFLLQLVAKKPDVDLWIIGGDFNMVEHPEDRSSNAKWHGAWGGEVCMG